MTTKEEEKKINIEYGHRISHFYIRINANLHVDGHERPALIKEWIWMVKQINEDLKRDYIPRKVIEDLIDMKEVKHEAWHFNRNEDGCNEIDARCIEHKNTIQALRKIIEQK